MENATKALLMAGGILIAIIIITLLIKTYGNISAFQKEQISVEEAQRIEEFNKDYTKYENQYVYGTEVITVINRTLNYQEKQGIEIKVEIDFKAPYTYIKNNKKYTTKELILKKDGEKYDFMDFTINNTNNTGDSENIKNRAFQCTEVKLDDATGRVTYIHFVEKMYNGGSVTM